MGKDGDDTGYAEDNYIHLGTGEAELERNRDQPLLSMSPIFRRSSCSFMSDSLKTVLPQASGTEMVST